MNGNQPDLKKLVKRFEDEHIKVLLTSIQPAHFIKELNLAFNMINDSGAIILAEYLKVRQNPLYI